MPKGIFVRTKKWKLSEQAKLNIGKARVGYKTPEETKEKISKKLYGRARADLLGEKHPGWVGGSLRYRRKQALIRDNFTCKMCGLYDTEIMDVDHIEPKSRNPELYKELSNLQTLCPNCHRRKTLKEKGFQKAHLWLALNKK